MEPLKIAHISWSGGTGGIERVIQTLAREQQKAWNVSVVLGQSGGIIADELKAGGIDVKILGLSNGFSMSPFKLANAKSIFSSFDILHFHSFNPLMMVAGVLSGKKIIYTFHSLSHLRKKQNWRDRFNATLLKFILKEYASSVTTVSRFAHQSLQPFLDGIELTVVPNPVKPLDEVVKVNSIREQLALNKDTFVILCFSRLVHHKRIDLLIDSLAKIKSDIPKFHLILAGEGPEKKSLEGKAKNVLKGHFSSMDYKTPVPQLLASSNLCVFPFHAESFGVVALESMQQGVPALVLEDGGGLAETMRTIKTHNMVANDPRDLSSKIISFYQTPLTESLISELKSQALNYTPTVINDLYMELYRR